MSVAQTRGGVGGGALLEETDAEPRRTAEATFGAAPFLVNADMGTEVDSGILQNTGMIGVWNFRFSQWRQAFEERISPRIRRYWHIWRNYDEGSKPGPGQEWRDRTVMPQAFKELSTRVPRSMMGVWGQAENYTVEGRGFNDDDYTEKVRQILEYQLDSVGQGDPQKETFLKRTYDGTMYREIMGHVWWKVWWRKEGRWIHTKTPNIGPDGKVIDWNDIEVLEDVLDNVDITWIPLTHLAIDVYGKRRWCIEYVRTSVEALEAENKNYEESTGQRLYSQEALDSIAEYRAGSYTREVTDEPRDTEHWPLDVDSQLSFDPDHRPVDLWLCWDNVKGTLTKIANRRIILDHGYAPTPDKLDPFIGDPAVPVPGIPYGDSIFNWTSSLYTRQTRLVRARMDETIANLFQQYLVREGALGSTQWFWRPMGMATVQQQNQDRPISDSIYLVPRRPVPAEAYNEERHAQQQSESVSDADALTQGAEGTSKSRDVTAAEVNQRIVQGGQRSQAEILYHKACVQRPMLQKVFDLCRMNMTKPQMVQLFGEEDPEPIDLRDLQRPIDIKIGNSMLDSTQLEKLQEIQAITETLADPNFAAVAKHRDILLELMAATRSLKRARTKFVKTEDEIAKQQAEQAMAAQGDPAAVEGEAAPPAAAGDTTGAGPAGLAGPTGSNGEAPPTPTDGGYTEI